MPELFPQGLFDANVEQPILDFCLENSVFASTSQGAGGILLLLKQTFGSSTAIGLFISVTDLKRNIPNICNLIQLIN